jgi:conjugative relaxase-like TrwC/TraI family protein
LLRITASMSAEAAVAYFREQFLSGDYYAEDGKTVGRWLGKGAEMLGPTGEVDEDAYRNLCHNRTPDGQGNLTPITRDGRRVGYDFTFSVPKSVSLGYLLDKDERILDAFKEAVRETMADIEREMKTRVRVDGGNEDRTTGNIVAAEFFHLTARPIGGIPDPQLHAHVFVHNVTWDEIEKRFKAAQFGDIKGDARYYEAIFHSRLAYALAQQGYITERKGDYWELGGVSPEMIEAFSRRTAQINEFAKEHGITDPDEKADLGRRTRESKEQSKPRHEVEAAWRETADKFGYDGIERGKARTTISAAAAVQYALDKGFEKASVLRELDVLEDAMRRSFGVVHERDVHKAFEAREDLIRRPDKGGKLLTTQEVLQEETRFLDLARAGLNRHPPIKAERHEFVDPKLDKDQRGAVEHVLKSTDWVTLVRGIAGTGKTTLMKEAIAAIKQQGNDVIVLAPSITASRDGLRDEGFKEANTLAMFLTNQAMQHQAKGQVIWVDEMGQVGAKHMRQFLELAKVLDARVIGSGDAKQHGSVLRGDAMYLLQSEAGIVPFTMRSIKRQKNPIYRQVVELLAEGRTLEGFDLMVKQGWVREFESDKERLDAIAKDFINIRDERKSAVIVAPTHAEGRAVTGVLREALFDRGDLKGEEKSFRRLQRVDWSLPERQDPHKYQEGMVVQFQRGTAGFIAGERLRVKGMNRKGEIEVTRASGATHALELKAAPCFAVFEEDVIQLAVGDQIRVTGKGMTLDTSKSPRKSLKKSKGRDGKADSRTAINNGRMLAVAGFTKEGHIVTENNWTLSKDFGHLAHGYTLTSHTAQSKTADRVLASQPSASLRAANQAQFYVTVSRGRDSPMVYTDSIKQLREAIQRSSARMSATHLARLPMAVAHHVEIQRRQEEQNYPRVQQTNRQVQRGIVSHLYPPRVRERSRGR